MGEVKTVDIARGRWLAIHKHLGVPSKILDGRFQPCPFCQGKDRFRYSNWKDDGYFICNQCGSYSGMQFLMKFYGWTFAETANRIDELFRTSWRASMSPQNVPRNPEIRIAKSVRDCALWLRKRYPDRLEAWLERHDIEVRWWLEMQES